MQPLSKGEAVADDHDDIESSQEDTWSRQNHGAQPIKPRKRGISNPTAPPPRVRQRKTHMEKCAEYEFQSISMMNAAQRVLDLDTPEDSDPSAKVKELEARAASLQETAMAKMEGFLQLNSDWMSLASDFTGLSMSDSEAQGSNDPKDLITQVGSFSAAIGDRYSTIQHFKQKGDEIKMDKERTRTLGSELNEYKEKWAATRKVEQRLRSERNTLRSQNSSWQNQIESIKALESQKAASHHEICRLRRMNLENRENDMQAIKTLEGRIAQLELEKIADRRIDVQTIEALRGENADSRTEIERLNRTISDERRINVQTIQTLKGRATQSELEKTENQRTIGALRSQNAHSQTEVERLNGMVIKYENAISEYTKANFETVKELKRQFDQHEARTREPETAEAEATNRATTADPKLRTYEKIITRLGSEPDDAREELELANATHATALEDAPHELESLQERATTDNHSGGNERAKRKRPAGEMLEEDVPAAVGHAYDLHEIRDPDFEDPNIPGDILDKLHQQFDRWDQKSGPEWPRQITKTRCVEARCAKISSKHLHGNEHACNHCEKRGRVCVVIRHAGIVNLLPVYQDGEAVGPDDESYWTK